jgi:hypothetical protein
MGRNQTQEAWSEDREGDTGLASVKRQRLARARCLEAASADYAENRGYSEVSYANGGYRVSQPSFVPAIAESRGGDKVLLCLVSIPKNCPPEDDRGRLYSGTNLRTGGSWLLPDSIHMCGGA